MTPLVQKLQMKPGKSWLIYNPPSGYLTTLKPLPEGTTCTSKPAGKFDGIQLFVKNKTQLSAALLVIVPLLRADTIFWVSYPKKSSGVETDLKMQHWDEMQAIGLEGVASISVDDTWAGSRFRPLGQAKISGTAKSDIRKSDFAAFIDVDKKLITLPPDIQRLLKRNPSASRFYEQLSYSNKKEYVLWILTAKQEKTRAERLAKMVEKLIAGKKNPAEK
jgi:hypothetical protein